MPFRSNVQRFLRDVENPFSSSAVREIDSGEETAGARRFSPGEGFQSLMPPGSGLPSFQPTSPAAFLGGGAPPQPVQQVGGPQIPGGPMMPGAFQGNPFLQNIDPNQFVGQFNQGAAQMSGLANPLGYNPYQGADFFWNPMLQLTQGAAPRPFYGNVEGRFQPPQAPGAAPGPAAPPPAQVPTLPAQPPPQGTGESLEHQRNCRRYGYSDLGPC